MSAGKEHPLIGMARQRVNALLGMLYPDGTPMDADSFPWRKLREGLEDVGMALDRLSVTLPGTVTDRAEPK